MHKNFDKLCNEILSIIEIQEAGLLNWGFYSSGVDLPRILPEMLDELPELENQKWEKHQQEGKTINDVIQNLKDRKLVFRLQDGSYRTRFAETVRLLSLLKQRFSDDDWAVARRLVSDLRIQLQRRRYPKWEIPINELVAYLNDQSVNDFQIEIIKELLKIDGGEEYLEVANFQKEAIQSILNSIRTNHDDAIVIGAGTGAGKTKAFYIPALAHIAKNIDNSTTYLQALAIYPRTELLKDQFAEAFDETRKLDNLLKRNNRRAISIGVYYGGTPYSANSMLENRRYNKWDVNSDNSGYICPFFACPNEQNHELIWYSEDIKNEVKDNKEGKYGIHTILKCSSCDFETEANELYLTRDQMQQRPPDILFTTTEMLNRRMSRVSEGALFGIGQEKLPRFLLLDEIHMHEGIAGSQVAYLIRRWRRARGYRTNQNLCIVGLSATLSQAIDFFSKLTGIPEHHTEYITPKEEDYTEEGFEYNLVLKGDPVSGTSLLSTSVQTGMLIGRVLDQRNNPITKGVYGQRIFGFTDKLDVINRWFFIMNDAEFRQRLSRYRRSDIPNQYDQRNDQGQIWKMSEGLGYDLNQPLRLGRTTSQDPGVLKKAKLIIATSTLEVGYNDVSVGAVIQHKAPRSAASFLQRKGRAGRTREMRPWMIVITSAYGRDRWAFQHAEALFTPELPPINLPISNYYVQKIQAAYTIMDWAGKELKNLDPEIDIWKLLSSGSKSGRSNSLSEQRKRLKNLLLAILEGSKRKDFEKYIQSALKIEDQDDDFWSILWGEPRSLYFEVIPTLIRQLETDWRMIKGKPEQKWEEQNWKDKPSRYPMPDFVPSALFSNLNNPEVQITLPSQNGDEEIKSMDVAQAITEFSPARANKRFALNYRDDTAHWLTLPDKAQLTRERINIDLLNINLDNSPIEILKDEEEYIVFRPLEITLDELPREVRSTSTSELIWKSDFLIQQFNSINSEEKYSSDFLWFQEKSPWRKFIREINIFTRTNNSWIDVTRFSIGAKIDTRKIDGEKYYRTLYYEEPNEGKLAGIGFTLSVDGIRIIINRLNTTELKSNHAWKTLYQSFGKEFFRYKLRNHPRLLEMGNSIFTIDWLWQLELSMITATAVAQQCSIKEAIEDVHLNRTKYAERTLKVIFQSQREEGNEEIFGRLHQQIIEMVEEPSVGIVLYDTSKVLWDDTDLELDGWLEEVYASSLGATIFTVITKIVPDIDHDELIMTVDGVNIWITENAAGGVGIISKIVDAISNNPRNFELELLDTIEHCDREQIANHLRAIANMISSDNEYLQSAFTDLRNTTDLPTLLISKEVLSNVLESNGVSATRPLMVAVNSKYLRPNSDTDSDKLIADLMEQWEEEELRIGLNIDLRVMAVAALRINSIKNQVEDLLDRVGAGVAIDDETQIFNLLQSMLWMKCTDSCPDCIEKWHRYQTLAAPSRNMLRTLLYEDIPKIIYKSDGWKEIFQTALKNDFQVQLICKLDEVDECKKDLATLINTPCCIGYQQFYPVIERIRRSEQMWNIQLAIVELMGGS